MAIEPLVPPELLDPSVPEVPEELVALEPELDELDALELDALLTLAAPEEVPPLELEVVDEPEPQPTKAKVPTTNSAFV